MGKGQGVQVDERSSFEEEMVWVGDTGASSHMTKNKEGFEWFKKCDERVTFGTQGDGEHCEMMGKWFGRNMTKVKGHQFTQKGSRVVLKDVMCIPNLTDNLFSITKEMTKGAKVTNEGEVLVLTYPDGRAIEFDYKLMTHKGHLPSAVMKPLGADKTVEECDLKEMNRKFFHSAGCHQDEKETR